MSRWDRFCLYMIPICLVIAFAGAKMQECRDILGIESAAKRIMPGCRKHICTAHFDHGRTVIDINP